MRIASCVALSIDGLLAGGFLSACAPAAMGPVTVFADPGKYEYYSCEQIAAQRTYWTGRELEMKLLMDKADQGTGGAVVNIIAYQGDYVVAREELKVIDATARVHVAALSHCGTPVFPFCVDITVPDTSNLPCAGQSKPSKSPVTGSASASVS